MDVTLPDGTVIRNVPEGTTKEQLYAKLKANGYDVSKLTPPKPLTGPELQQQRDNALMNEKVAKDREGKIPLTTEKGTTYVADPRIQMGKAALARQQAEAQARKDAESMDVGRGITRGLSPYAIAAASGAAAGSPTGVGIPAGAMAAVTALGLTDLTAAAWNTLATPFGAGRMTSGSEAINAMTDAANLTAPPTTSAGRIAETTASMAGGGVSGAKIMEGAGRFISRLPGELGRTGNFFAKPMTPGAAAFSAGMGGAGNQAALELGADPLVAMGAGLVSSLIPGPRQIVGIPRGAAAHGIDPERMDPRQARELADATYAARPRATTPPTTQQLEGRATASYNAAHTQGIMWNAANIRGIADRALARAIDPAHPDGPMPRSAIAPGVRRIMDEMAAFARTEGRIDSRDVDLYRQRLSAEIGVLTGSERTVGIRVREALDDFVSDPEDTINALRGGYAAARDAARTAQAAAEAAAERLRRAGNAVEDARAAHVTANTPATSKAYKEAVTAQAAAQREVNAANTAAEETATVLRDRASAMSGQDPDMQETVEAVRAARVTRDEAAAVARATEARARASEAAQIKLEDAATAAEARFAAVKAKNVPETWIEYRNAQSAARAARQAAEENRFTVDTHRAADSTAQAAADGTERARQAAIAARNARRDDLAPVDDAAARMGARNSALADARESFGDFARARTFDQMPIEAANSARGTDGDIAGALRAQVRRYVASEAADVARLPESTQRALRKFMNGGNLPTGGDLARILSWATPIPYLRGLVHAISRGAAQQAGNIRAGRSFNRLRDIVARGQDVPAAVESRGGNKMLNYVLAHTAQGN